jgi:hypothetical protein
MFEPQTRRPRGDIQNEYRGGAFIPNFEIIIIGPDRQCGVSSCLIALIAEPNYDKPTRENNRIVRCPASVVTTLGSMLPVL